MTGADVAAAARLWVGTPYVHRASLRGVGTDCLGLLRGMWREFFDCEPEPVPTYAPNWSEPWGRERLWGACARHMTAKPPEHEDMGDVLLFRMRDGSVAKHLGVQVRLGDKATFVHAYSGHGVLETFLTAPWQRRIVARFVFPTVQARDV